MQNVVAVMSLPLSLAETNNAFESDSQNLVDGWSEIDVYGLKLNTVNLIYFPATEPSLQLHQLFPIKA